MSSYMEPAMTSPSCGRAAGNTSPETSRKRKDIFYKLLPNMEIEKTTATNEVEKVFVEKLKRDLNCVVWDAERSDPSKRPSS